MPILFHRHFSLGTLIYGCLLAILVILGGLYVAFQARHLIGGPSIELQNASYEGTAPTVTLAGTAENIVSLSLNGRVIYTDDNGNFSERLVLPVGYTVVTLRAEDRYGRSRSLEREYVRTEDVTPQS